MPTKRTILLLTLAASLASCNVGPTYHAPKLQVPADYAESHQTTGTNPATQPSHATTTAPPVAEWWRTFRDPELDHLVDVALRENLDLQIATSRLLQARYQRGIAASDLLPDLNATGSYTHARGSSNVNLPFGNSSGSGGSSKSGSRSVKPLARSNTSGSASVGPSATATPSSPFGQGGLPGVTTDLFQTGFDASWEIDIFGGTRRRVEAANDRIAEAIASRRDITITLLAEIARDYMELRGAQRRLDVAHQTLTAETDTLNLTRSARKNGLVTDLDVTRAASQVAFTESTIPPLEARVRRSIHALSILLARSPDALAAELESTKPLPTPPPEIPIGLPSDLLRRRPDIRRAERAIAAANANVGVATADLFPKFGLTGSVGLDATRFSKLFDWNSRYFLISPTIVWPVFDAGRIVSNIHLQKQLKQESVLQYKRTVLAALRDVEDALINYATEQARRAALAEALHQARQSLEIAREQYKQGLVDFLNVLDAQRTVFFDEDALARSDQTVLTNLVALYKSLGGGWQLAETSASMSHRQ